MTETRARLIGVHVPKNPEGVVLLLHGGASRTAGAMVSPTQLSVLRMVPIARRVAREGAGRLAVFRVLNSVRGWDSTHTPVQDAVWAMARARRTVGRDLPVGLIGHSLGGRAALVASAEPGVVSAVALAPWVYPDDAPTVHGRHLLIVHGTADRIASPDRSAAVARALAGANQVGYIRIDGGTHAMLSHHRRFDGLAADFTAATLLGRPGSPLVERVLAGESWIDA